MPALQLPSSVGEETQFQRVETKALHAKPKRDILMTPSLCYPFALPAVPTEDVAKNAKKV